MQKRDQETLVGSVEVSMEKKPVASRHTSLSFDMVPFIKLLIEKKIEK